MSSTKAFYCNSFIFSPHSPKSTYKSCLLYFDYGREYNPSISLLSVESLSVLPTSLILDLPIKSYLLFADLSLNRKQLIIILLCQLDSYGIPLTSLKKKKAYFRQLLQVSRIFTVGQLIDEEESIEEIAFPWYNSLKGLLEC